MPAARVWNVDQLASRYAYVLLSRRVLRALAASTFVGGVMLVVVILIVPAVFLATAARPANRLASLLAILAILALMVLGIYLLTVMYVRTLAALAAGARKPIGILLTVVMGAVLVVGTIDVQRALGSDTAGPLWFLSLGALVIHVATGAALVIGPMEMRRADAFERAVLGEPRAGTGRLAEIARLLHLPDARAFRRRGRKRAVALVVLSLLLEGFAFLALFEWPDQLNRAAETVVAADLRAFGAAVAVAGALISAAGLLVSFLLLRWLLTVARRCREKARRLALLGADDVVADDPRPPVLFLRSFEEEQVPLAGARVPWFVRGFDPGSEYGTLEEMIVLNLTHVGPVVAVADPSRQEVPVGAARWRLEHGEWQQFVEEQIRASGLIVVGLAETAGLRWEIDAVRRIPGALEKTIFVCPPQSTQSPAVLAALTAALGDDGGLMPAAEGSFALMAARSADGHASVFAASALTETAYYVALRAAMLQQRDASDATAALTAGAAVPGTTRPASPAGRRRRTTPYASGRRD